MKFVPSANKSQLIQKDIVYNTIRGLMGITFYNQMNKNDIIYKIDKVVCIAYAYKQNDIDYRWNRVLRKYLCSNDLKEI